MSTPHTAPASAPRALAILGGSSMVTVVAGIASAKLAATLIGPSGVGRMSLVQGVAAAIAAIVELGLATSIVRAYNGPVPRPLGEFVSAARRLVAITGSLVLLLAVVFAGPGGDLVFGRGHHPLDFVLGTASGMPVALLAIENGTLIAAHRVGAVARVAVSTAFISPLVNFMWLSLRDQDGVAPGAFTSAVVVLLVAMQIRRRELARNPGERREPAERVATLVPIGRSLLRDGVPVMASALAGAAALLVLPIVVSSRLGSEDVGFFRAASVISIGYTAALTAVIGADFLPRVSRVRTDPDEVRRVVVGQARLLVDALVPVLSVVAAVLPLLVSVLYRNDFGPTVTILEWQLSGDILRIVASVLATAVFARYGGLVRLGFEVVGLGLLVGLSVFGLIHDGLSGLGWGFTLTYVCYLLMLAGVLGFDLRDAVTRRALVHIMVSAIVVGIPSAAVHATGRSWARLIGIPIAIAFAFPHLRRLLAGRRQPTVSS